MLKSRWRRSPDRRGSLGCSLRGFLLLLICHGLWRDAGGRLAGSRRWPRRRHPGGSADACRRRWPSSTRSAWARSKRLRDGRGPARDREATLADSIARACRPTAGSGALALRRPRRPVEELFGMAIEAAERRGALRGVARRHGMRCLLPCSSTGIWRARRPMRKWRCACSAARRSESQLGDLAQRSAEDARRARRLGGGRGAARRDLAGRRDPGPGLAGATLLIAPRRAPTTPPAATRRRGTTSSPRPSGSAWLPYANPEVLGWRTGLALCRSGARQRRGGAAARRRGRSAGPRGRRARAGSESLCASRALSSAERRG